MSKILVVDDDPLILELIIEYLNEGFEDVEVSWAKDGLSALYKIKGKDFDLLITDLAMPGYDGLMLIDKISELKDLPVIIISGDEALIRQAEKLNPLKIFKKPFDIPELVECIRDYIN